MFENIINFLRKLSKAENNKSKEKSKDKAKERLQLVLTQDRANVSADFLELMKQEIIDVIKKYIEVEENAIDVRITNKVEEDGTTGSPSLYANIPILNIKKETEKEVKAKVQAEQQENKKVQDKEIKKELEKNKPQKDEEAEKNKTQKDEEVEKEITTENNKKENPKEVKDKKPKEDNEKNKKIESKKEG